ncbi:MAG: putative serine/threonine kinase anti-sigma factor [Frankiales bacterium]|nr:putative serine/threonine kinase anti-sigma factor [Frankiales bacterium]
MEIKVSLSLPRDSVSVSVVRHLMSQSLRILEVADECIEDIETALSEACTNVLLHAAAGDEYFVSAGIDGERCVIEVIDAGHGFDSSSLANLASAPTAEQGRGMLLMQHLVDKITFTNRPEAGTIVHMEKALHWQDDDAIGKRLQRGDADLPVTARPAHG